MALRLSWAGDRFERSHNEAVRVETGRILQPRESRAPARHTDHGNYFTTGPEPPRATRPAPNDAVAVAVVFSYRLVLVSKAQFSPIKSEMGNLVDIAIELPHFLGQSLIELTSSGSLRLTTYPSLATCLRRETWLRVGNNARFGSITMFKARIVSALKGGVGAPKPHDPYPRNTTNPET